MRAALLRWYRRERRDMPWRRSVSPYRTWVSEIMLQQTTVAAVTPKYESFLKAFPGPRALAAAPEDEVLKHWAGLGYYARARNLRRAAQEVVAKHGGAFPSEFDEVLALPGVGRYTAGAILSIAFGKPYPVVDGNVIRVFSRLFGLRGRAKDPAFVKEIWKRAAPLVPKSAPGDWNQALMELGATVCTPESPSCGACPVAGFCVAFGKNIQDELPLPEKRREPTPVRWTCLWIVRGGKLLIWRRSEDERLLKNLWGLPEAGRVRAAVGKRLGSAAHAITRHALTVELREAALDERAELPPQARWVPLAKARDYLVSSLWLKLLKPR
ncbi:MAG TPA: A/G-specific adenine glycosylase [Elusimicrobiota bacterium]|nr:A/G-specific adenine glycosylase [Elusimicrobiota bacterium]